jgi:redox-sensitive bicupin YhaK (pirin superfamily)
MITLRRNTDRRHVPRGKHNVWQTFYQREGLGSPADDFGILTAFNEIRLSPGAVFASHPRAEAEIVTYVCRGALAQEDSKGSSGVVHVGEFQCMTIGHGIRYKETNASQTGWAHIFRISLRPSEVGLDCSHEQERFATAERHNRLCVIASPDGRKKSLRIHQDALICSSVLDPGHHLIHELAPRRSAWLHIIYGEANLHDIILTQGDGVGVTNEPSVSLTAQESTEMLLVELGPTPKLSAGGVVP